MKLCPATIHWIFIKGDLYWNHTLETEKVITKLEAISLSLTISSILILPFSLSLSLQREMGVILCPLVSHELLDSIFLPQPLIELKWKHVQLWNQLGFLYSLITLAIINAFKKRNVKESYIIHTLTPNNSLVTTSFLIYKNLS